MSLLNLYNFPIPDPRSPIPDPRSPIPDPRSPIPDPQTPRMRICLFTPTFLPIRGGAERAADVIARGLIARGHRVTVLAQRDPQGREVDRDDVPYEVVRYRRPPAQHRWPGLLARRLVKLHRREKFDVVLAWYAYPCGYAAAVARDRCTAGRRSRGRGWWSAPRGADLYPNFHQLEKPGVERIIREGYQRADRIVAMSQWLIDRLETWVGPPLPPIDLVWNGVNAEALEADAERALDEPPVSRPFFLHLARVEPVKRHVVAVEAVARIADELRRRGVSLRHRRRRLGHYPTCSGRSSRHKPRRRGEAARSSRRPRKGLASATV